MKMTSCLRCPGLLLALFALAAAVAAQNQEVPTPAPTPAAAQASAAAPAQETPPPSSDAPAPVLHPEGTLIINFPSADTSPPRTLHLHFTHRFSDPVQGSDIHNLFSFDSGAEVGIGLSYAPIKNLEIGLLRERTLEDYEFHAKVTILSGDSPVHVAVRIGDDWRNERGYPDEFSFFVQGIASVFLFERVRISAVPTFSSRAAGQRFVLPIRENVFNVLFGVSGAITRTVNVHGELVPRRAQSPGTGWIVSLEKTVLRHRFAFTAGNMKSTTVDQYIAPDFNGLPRSNIYLGFNIVRQWKL
jgi:hypothetical protein